MSIYRVIFLSKRRKIESKLLEKIKWRKLSTKEVKEDKNPSRNQWKRPNWRKLKKRKVCLPSR